MGVRGEGAGSCRHATRGRVQSQREKSSKVPPKRVSIPEPVTENLMCWSQSATPVHTLKQVLVCAVHPKSSCCGPTVAFPLKTSDVIVSVAFPATGQMSAFPRSELPPFWAKAPLPASPKHHEKVEKLLVPQARHCQQEKSHWFAHDGQLRVRTPFGVTRTSGAAPPAIEADGGALAPESGCA
jgi:hypothetical protein